jgi:FtsH-binding integral membrane protein
MNTRYASDRSQTLSMGASQQLAMSRFISRTYGWMFVGLLLTAFVSYFLASSEAFTGYIVQNRGIFMIAVLAEFGLVLALTAFFRRLSTTAATLGFLAYSTLNGVTMSVVFMAYAMGTVAQVFFITAGMFGGLALFGTVTRKNLTGLGSFVGMGLWGLILVGFANMFIGSESLSMGLGVAGVLIFSGLTAYHAQQIRAMAYQAATSGGIGSAEADKGAIFGALMLYLNFINLFLSLLRLFGGRRR